MRRARRARCVRRSGGSGRASAGSSWSSPRRSGRDARRPHLFELEGEIRDAAVRSVVLRQAIDSDGDGHCRKAMRASDREAGWRRRPTRLPSVPWPRPSGRAGGRDPDRLARVRRERRRASRRIRRVRARRAAGRPRPRPRDEGERGFAEASRIALLEPGPRPSRGSVPALRHLRRLPLPGPRLHAADRREAASGARRARASRRLRRSAPGRSSRPARSTGTAASSSTPSRRATTGLSSSATARAAGTR